MINYQRVLKCLNNIVKVRDNCDTSNNENIEELYTINDLPNFNFKAGANSIEDGSQELNAVEFYMSRIKHATKETVNELFSYMTSKNIFKFFSKIHDEVIGMKLNKFTPANLVPNQKKGIRINDIKYNELESLKLNSLQIYANNTGNYDLYVTDGLETKIINFDLVANVTKEVIVDFISSTEIIEAQILDINGTYSPVQIKNYFRSCGCSQNPKNYLYHVEDIVNSTAQSTSHKFGMICNISKVCSIDSIICGLRNELSRIVFYRTAMDILEYRLNSSNENYGKYQVMNEVKYQDPEYQSYKNYKTRYTDSLNQLCHSLTNILQQKNSPCLYCMQQKNGTIKF